MAKLIMTKGLPGSGKTTWAQGQVVLSGSEKVVRVNKDDIRRELEASGWVWSHENEKAVVHRRDELISQALKQGKTVISDDTNLAPKHEARLRQLAQQFRASFEVKDFTDVTVDCCIERDAGREGKARVGEKVIRTMAEQYAVGRGKVEKVAGLQSAIICDLDGTAAKIGDRGPYDTAKAGGDHPNEPVRTLLIRFAPDHQIIYMSGREEKFREISTNWLRDHGFPTAPLYMRRTNDYRKDYVVKRELFDAHVRGKFNVLFCLDDRDQIVKLWRDMGLTCFQVDYGAF